MKISPLLLAPPIIFLAIASMFLWGMQREDPDALPLAILGQETPDFEMEGLAGKPTLSAAMLRDGKPKLVNYWASWCAPCRVEHPHLTRLAEEGVSIYGINYKDSPENALSFLSELGDPYLGIGVDASGRVALDWGLYGVPETYVIDGRGRIVLRHAGPVTREVADNVILPALRDVGYSRSD